MKRLLSAVAIFATLQATAQQVNPVPDYVFRNQMSVGRNAVTDTAAYFSIGPRYGAVKGFMPPIVSDTATFSSGKRNGLLIFSVQKNKFLYWDSVRVQWSDMAGSSGSYITGKGLTGYVPQFTDTATIDTSALYTLGSQLGVGTNNFTYTSSGRAVMELNGSAGGIYGFKSADTGRGYLLHNGTSMELATTTATGSIFFNTNSATRGSISSAGVWRLHGLAGTGDRVVVASSNGTLSAASSATGLVDTLTISTRAWRQKGLDSLAALEVSGSGTTNYVPKFTAGSTIGNSQIIDNAASGVSIGAKTLIRDDGPFVTGSNISGGTNNMAIGTPTSGGFLSLYTNATERLRITSDGDILHRGTYNPLSAANRGNIMLNGSASNIIGFSNNSALRGYIFHTDSDFQFYNNTTGGRVGLYTEGTARLWIQANGRIGINTTTDAGYQFDVNGTGYFASTLTLGGGSRLSAVSGNALNLNTNGTDRVTISSGGNVGIGTASPSGKLDVTDALVSDYASIVRLRNSNAGTTNTNLAIEFWDRSTSINGAVIGTRSNIAGNWGGDIIFKNQQNGSPQTTTTSLTEVMKLDGANQRISLSPAGTELFRFASTGELLINTTSDAGDYKLQVSGAIYNTGNALLNATSGETWIGGTDYGAYQLSVTNNMYVDGLAVLAGNGVAEVRIGTTSDAGAYRLQVAGDFYNTGSITTGAPSGGSIKPWKIGEAATVSPTSPNRTLRVEVDGVVYYIHAKTTND